MAVTAAGSGEGESVYGAAKTSVWWDIENCQVPRGSDAHVIAQNISSALADVGYKGAVSISAYGDTNKIPNAVQQALSSTGIALNHVPAGVKDASDKKILVDMLFWAVDNPPPANYLLISGDRDFSNALHQLRMRRYNILLAHAPNVSQALVAAAKRVWLWTSLLAGGTPLQNSDSCYPSNAAVGSKTYTDAGQKTLVDTTPSNGSSGTRNEDISFVERGDDTQHNGNKQVWRNQILLTGNISRASSLTENKESHSLQFQKQMSMPVISSSEAYGSTQLKHTAISSSCSSTQMTHGESGFPFQSEGKQINKAPHEFFAANKQRASVVSSNQHPCPGGPINSGNNFNQQIQYSQPFRPSGMPPSLPTYFPHSHNYSSFPQPHQQSAPSFRPGLPDFNRLKISDFPSNAYQTVSFHPQNSGLPSSYMHMALPSYHEMSHRPHLNAVSSNISGTREASVFQMPSTTAQDLIRNIQVALNQLKANKIIPTEANISNCIRYGMGMQSFNFKMALNCALENNVVVMHKLGANLPFYIGKNDKLWRCVNPLDNNVRHPEATWDAIQNFLSSAQGQSVMSSTECRYHAAIVLKKSCLEHLPLGDILQILDAIVQVKKWIIPSFHGWQPLSFTLKVASGSNAGVGTSTKVES